MFLNQNELDMFWRVGKVEAVSLDLARYYCSSAQQKQLILFRYLFLVNIVSKYNYAHV